jgi:hypothetical protein
MAILSFPHVKPLASRACGGEGNLERADGYAFNDEMIISPCRLVPVNRWGANQATGWLEGQIHPNHGRGHNGVPIRMKSTALVTIGN